MRLANTCKRPRAVRPVCRILLFALLLISGATLAWAWGDLAHQMVNAAAIENLPEPLRSYFQARRQYLLEHASEPDEVAHASPEERPHHYTEINGYSRPPFRAFQRRFVTQHWNPPSSQCTHGDSIWQIEAYSQRLSDDMRRRRWQDADHDAIYVAHYAADLTQPLHTVTNYDGQETNQRGIHARFETELVRDLAGNWKLRPERAAVVNDLRAEIFRVLLESYAQADGVFSADRTAAAGGYLAPQFMPRFEKLAGPVALRQMNEASGLVSSLWLTAWVEAGKPALPRRHPAH